MAAATRSGSVALFDVDADMRPTLKWSKNIADHSPRAVQFSEGGDVWTFGQHDGRMSVNLYFFMIRYLTLGAFQTPPYSAKLSGQDGEIRGFKKLGVFR